MTDHTVQVIFWFSIGITIGLGLQFLFSSYENKKFVMALERLYTKEIKALRDEMNEAHRKNDELQEQYAALQNQKDLGSLELLGDNNGFH